MSWNIVADIVAGINGVGSLLSGLPDQLQAMMVNIVTLVLYPVYVVGQLIIYDINFIYSSISGMVNLVIAIINIPISLISVTFNLPPMMVSIILFQIGIASGIRIYRWLKEVKGWIPTSSGDSG